MFGSGFIFNTLGLLGGIYYTTHSGLVVTMCSAFCSLYIKKCTFSPCGVLMGFISIIKQLFCNGDAVFSVRWEWHFKIQCSLTSEFKRLNEFVLLWCSLFNDALSNSLSLSHTHFIYIYIYIYVCVCVCVYSRTRLWRRERDWIFCVAINKCCFNRGA